MNVIFDPVREHFAIASYDRLDLGCGERIHLIGDEYGIATEGGACFDKQRVIHWAIGVRERLWQKKRDERLRLLNPEGPLTLEEQKRNFEQFQELLKEQWMPHGAPHALIKMLEGENA